VPVRVRAKDKDTEADVTGAEAVTVIIAADEVVERDKVAANKVADRDNLTKQTIEIKNRSQTSCGAEIALDAAVGF